MKIFFIIRNQTILLVFKLSICLTAKKLIMHPGFKEVTIIFIIFLLLNLPKIRKYIFVLKTSIKKMQNILLSNQ